MLLQLPGKQIPNKVYLSDVMLTSIRMNKDLQLTKLEGTISHYSIVTIVFFATYIVFQPPATIIVR